MFRILTFTALICLIGLPNFAQEVLWATKVLEKSSESVDEKYSPKYRAIQVLGSPSVLPQTISSPCSWRPAGMSYGEDYIKVGFAKAIRPRQIIVGETLGAGAIGRIFGYTKDGKEILLYQNAGNNFRKRAGIWNEIIPPTESEIIAIKLLIVHSLNKGPKEYDCIGVSSSDVPFQAKINVAEGLPKDSEKINLGTHINSKFSEVAPLVSPDGKYLYFTRLNHPKNFISKSEKRAPEVKGIISQDVWVSALDANGNWKEAQNMRKPIHEGSKNAAATIAMDGKSIFSLNAETPSGEYEAGLTKVTLKNERWTNKRRVNIQDFEALSYIYNNEQKKETEFSMSSDEKYLVMGLMRRDTYGDKDLYVSFKTGTNTYSKPINLGAVLNTAGNEGSPFLAADNKTLYFNSNGHPGYGDMDIFMTTRLDDTWTNWTEPVNLGPQINSQEFDGYISIPASGEYAYFSSAKNSLGLDDLFKIKLFPSIKPEPVQMYEFQFMDSLSNKEVIPEIVFQNLNKNEEHQFIYDEDSKSYKTVLPLGSKYKIQATLKDYKPIIETINLEQLQEYKEVKKVYIMLENTLPKETKKPAVEEPKKDAVAKAKEPETEPNSVEKMSLAKGKKMILQEIYFDQSKADLRPESFPELERIKRVMLNNPKMIILLEGHTDNQGDAKLNFKLAENRINNVKEYLIKDQQINPERIMLKSWGQYRPLKKNSSEEARQQNRRVEFTIIEM